MKKLLLLIIAFAFVGGCKPKLNYYEPTADPKEFILENSFFAVQPYYASSAHMNKHRDEVCKTFVVNEVVELGDLRAIFYSFSIGTDIVRGCQWAAIVDGYLYAMNYVSSYDAEEISTAYEVDIDELKEILIKEVRWKESPSRKWNM